MSFELAMIIYAAGIVPAVFLCGFFGGQGFGAMGLFWPVLLPLAATIWFLGRVADAGEKLYWKLNK